MNITFDQASFTCAEGSECTITGHLDNLLGEIQTDIMIPVGFDVAVDPLTSMASMFLTH